MCKYCMKPGYYWCCPSCFSVFEEGPEDYDGQDYEDDGQDYEDDGMEY